MRIKPIFWHEYGALRGITFMFLVLAVDRTSHGITDFDLGVLGFHVTLRFY